jgi:hypothetical protein
MRLSTSKTWRWFADLALVALGPLSVALIFPILTIGLALLATQRNWGLRNQVTLP